MKVKLNRAWFAPDSSLYPRGEHDFPNDWEKRLPTTAEIISEVVKEVVETVPHKSAQIKPEVK